MNNYWSNDDDKKVGYTAEPYQRKPRVNGGPRTSDTDASAAQKSSDAFSSSPNLDQRNETEYRDPYRPAPQYGGDRSTFISEEAKTPPLGDSQYRYEPQFKFIGKPLDGGGYQVHTETPPPNTGGKHGRFWLKLFIILLILALIGGGAYVFRYDILTLAGKLFGEEVVWKIMPTPAPTETVPDVPAYVDTVMPEIKELAEREISAVAGDLDLVSYAVTEHNVVLKRESENGANEFYLFDYDTGRLLGYYEGVREFVPCAKYIFYIAEEPWLITSRGFPLADLEALERNAGSSVTIGPMVGGWAIVKDAQGTMLNYIGEDGKLISTLWFIKTFPFTGDTTLAYVDTGNVTATDNRYALYLLRRDGETTRLNYVPDTDGIMESVCDMAFTQGGEMHSQDEALTLIMTTDDAAAYVNCGALSVRDPETGLYGLFVGGVQQYPFAFDSIEPVSSDLEWEAVKTGYVTRYTVQNHSYPLPRSYSFILRKNDTEQVISIAAVSAYPILFD